MRRFVSLTMLSVVRVLFLKGVFSQFRNSRHALLPRKKRSTDAETGYPVDMEAVYYLPCGTFALLFMLYSQYTFRTVWGWQDPLRLYRSLCDTRAYLF